MEDSAQIFSEIIQGKGTEAQNNVVIANAAMALQTIHPNTDLHACVDQARTALDSGKAKKCFEQLIQLNA